MHDSLPCIRRETRYDEISLKIDPPQNIIATPGDETVIISWDTVAGVDGYDIYRSKTSGSGFTKLNDELIFGDTYTDKTAKNDNTYYYIVKAVKGDDESPSSIEISATAAADESSDGEEEEKEEDDDDDEDSPGFDVVLLLFSMIVILVLMARSRSRRNE